jgi:hypothetical protein
MNGERVDTDDSDDRDETAAAGAVSAATLDDDEEAIDEHPEPDSRMTPEPPPS